MSEQVFFCRRQDFLLKEFCRTPFKILSGPFQNFVGPVLVFCRPAGPVRKPVVPVVKAGERRGSWRSPAIDLGGG